MVFVLKNCVYVCEKNEILVFTGLPYQQSDGSTKKYRYVTEGQGVKIPLLEKCQTLSIQAVPIQLNCQNLKVKKRKRVSLTAEGSVQISTQPEFIDNAIHHFLHENRQKVKDIGTEIIDTHLKSILTKFTDRDLNNQQQKVIEMKTNAFKI